VDVGLVPAQNIDWLYFLRQGKCFRFGSTLGPSVGVNSQCQLLNPVGSGVTSIVHRIKAAIGTTDFVFLQDSGTPLTTLVGSGRNLSLGGTVSVCKIRTDLVASFPGSQVTKVQLLANTTYPIADDWVALLGAGQGLVLEPSSVNVQIDYEYEWVEF